MISGFHREVAENCALLGHYAASTSNLLQTFWDNLMVPSSGVKNSKKKEENENKENEIDRLFRNVGKKLPLITA